MSRNRLTDHNVLIRVVGLLFLVAASLSRWLVHPSASLSMGFRDAATGFLYGVWIGCALLSLRRSGCRRSSIEEGPGARP